LQLQSAVRRPASRGTEQIITAPTRACLCVVFGRHLLRPTAPEIPLPPWVSRRFPGALHRSRRSSRPRSPAIR
jgi:hypothetical protein